MRNTTTIITCLSAWLLLNSCRRSMEIPEMVMQETSPVVHTVTTTYGNATSNYDNLVLSDQPVAYWNAASGTDATGNGHNGVVVNHPAGAVLPDGGASLVFNGSNQYLEVNSAADLSVPLTGVLTLEVWARPDTLAFSTTEGAGYINWMGKGVSGAYEYAARMYTQHPSDPAIGSRLSGQAFNLPGGNGAVSYYQPTSGWPLQAHEWIHYTLVINTKATSGGFTTGYIRLYVHRRDSAGNIVTFEDMDALSDNNITPGAGNAPFRVGTRDLHSWFPGAIGKIAVYNYELNGAQLLGHAKKMFGYDSDVLSDHPIAFWNTASGTDITGNGHAAAAFNGPGATLLPDGGTAPVFNGINQYLEVNSSPDLSVPATGVLTLEAWMRPDVLNVVDTEGSGYVHWMGKGVSGNYEYAARMYGQHPTGHDSPRVNRVSGYVFNPIGLQGAGSYYQPTAAWPLQSGEWIHYMLVINNSVAHPYTKLYVHRRRSDGAMVEFTDQDLLSDYDITPQAGSAPFRLATVGFGSWFQGAIGKVAIYNYEPDATRVMEHAVRMFGGG